MIAACIDKGCPLKDGCLRFQAGLKGDLTNRVHAWFRGAEDSCEYYLPLQQHEPPSS